MASSSSLVVVRYERIIIEVPMARVPEEGSSERARDEGAWATEMARWKKTCICRVPEWVKRLTSIHAYRPWMVSLGPFHHGDSDFLPMEEHKRQAVQHIVKRSGKPFGDFFSAIEKVVDALQEAYEDLDDRWRGEDKVRFIEMMVLDGCFLLEFMRTDQLQIDGLVDEDYAENDPIFSGLSFHYVWPKLRTDIITMENQLPLLALQTLLAVQHGPQSAYLVNNWVMCLLRCKVVQRMNNLALNPLDIFHRSICGPPSPGPACEACDHEWDCAMPSALELHEAGIRFKKCRTTWESVMPSAVELRRDEKFSTIRGVSFRNGVLYMPLMSVDEETEKIFLNLMAFERLYRDAGNEVTDYVFFMDNIINTGEDVALLRSQGVMEQTIGSDEEVAKLFNTINKGALMSRSSKLHNVHREVKAHCNKTWNRWRASFVQTYLRNPWVFISLVAAVILLVFTLFQTVYTVVPFYTK